MDANIEIKTTKDIDPHSLMKELMNAGWKLHFNGIMEFLPQNDNGKYNWTFSKYDYTKLCNHMSFSQNIIYCGVNIYWEKDELGGTLLIYKNSIIFTPSVNSVYINTTNLKIIDWSWYLSKLICALLPFNPISYQIEQSYW